MSRDNSSRGSGLIPSPISNSVKECLHAANERWKKFHADVEDPTKISRLGLGADKNGWKWAESVSAGYFVVDKSLASNGNSVDCMNHNWYRLYESGQGVPKDYAEALKWYRKAAEQGDALAQTQLGLMYIKGMGAPKDEAQAMAWLRKAAEQGYASAQAVMGEAYREGIGAELF